MLHEPATQAHPNQPVAARVRSRERNEYPFAQLEGRPKDGRDSVVICWSDVAAEMAQDSSVILNRALNIKDESDPVRLEGEAVSGDLDRKIRGAVATINAIPAETVAGIAAKCRLFLSIGDPDYERLELGLSIARDVHRLTAGMSDSDAVMHEDGWRLDKALLDLIARHDKALDDLHEMHSDIPDDCPLMIPLHADSDAINEAEAHTIHGLFAKARLFAKYPGETELGKSVAHDAARLARAADRPIPSAGPKPSREVLESYKTWLEYEHRLLTIELYPNKDDQRAAMGAFYTAGPAVNYHFHGKNGKPWDEMPQPSSRAAAVLGFVGCPLPERDPASFPADAEIPFVDAAE